MANPWFRLYSEFASDPKVQSMSEPMQRRLIMLFCLRCGNVLETLQEDEIVFALGITQDEWEKTKQIFVSKCFMRFISGKCNIINWNKRQFISDSSTERVRKYRARNETFQERSESVTVTPPDTDTDTDTEHIRDISPKPERHEYGSEKNVLMTDAQYSSLKDDLGLPLLTACIEELSTAKAMKGYKYKRDDLAIRKWVVDKVKRDKPSLFAVPPPEAPKPKPPTELDLEIQALVEREYAEKNNHANS